jgi:glycosyltransferase involved in cell wall biosynthesis
LDGLDVILFIQSPVLSDLPRVARQCGVRVVCVPNWEWLHPGLVWLEHVDGMLCPTRHTADLLTSWKERFRFRWRIDCVPWPVDTERFCHRPRRVCERFVFVNGSGGVQASAPDVGPGGLRRKGLEVLLTAARLAPDIRVIIYASRHQNGQKLSNVDWRPLPGDNRLLYCDGDVCVQPSHWEGLGLPLLECQASGMPLITTGAPPMNEHRALVDIPVFREQSVYLGTELCLPAALIRPEELAAVLRSVHGRRIAGDSRRARRFVAREHSWQVAGPRILRFLGQY